MSLTPFKGKCPHCHQESVPVPTAKELTELSAPRVRIAELESQLAAAKKNTEWKPIETAPKDGTAILVFPSLWNGRSASIARWNADEYANNPRPYWHRDDAAGRITTSRQNPPTHWIPLPEAPNDAARKEES